MIILIVFLIAFCLSLDAFSLATIYGFNRYNVKQELMISFIVGIFHFIMPILGNQVGSYILNIIPIKLNIIVSLIFILIGINMVFETQENQGSRLSSFFEMFVFSFAVSIDSFGTGVGFKLITNHTIVASAIFMFISANLTYIGLKFGKKIGSKIGKIANLFGGIILIILGIIYLIK